MLCISAHNYVPLLFCSASKSKGTRKDIVCKLSLPLTRTLQKDETTALSSHQTQLEMEQPATSEI